ncbi:MAG: GntR family transcriptional regulator [Endozoicomonadaceae bacterium]|nr:GntR family transcriptional regulator [Endozoicomonadaceae bacterium]
MLENVVKVGCLNRLTVASKAPFGVYLDGHSSEILLPKRYVPKGTQIGDVLDTFIYLDSDDLLIATTETPLAQVGELACLNVVEVNAIGAFLDWNLPKNLLVPFSEQKLKMVKGSTYIVFVYLDDRTHRIVASSKIDKHLNNEIARYRQGQAVSLLVVDRTELGYTAVIEGKHWGVIFHSDIHTSVRYGDRIDGFIKQVRPDGKIDLCLSKPGFDKIGMTELTQHILGAMKRHQGFLPLHDKSDPRLIKQQFSVSKRTFKMAIGALYKKRLITIERNGIHLMS